MNLRQMIEEAPIYDELLLQSNSSRQSNEMIHTLDILKENHCDINDKFKHIDEMIEIRNNLTEIISDTHFKVSDSKLERFAKEDIIEINQILSEIHLSGD